MSCATPTAEVPSLGVMTPSSSDTFCGYCGERLPSLGMNLKCCPFCAARFKTKAPTAPSLREDMWRGEHSKRHVIAPLLSAIIPGAGQIYNGQFFKGLFVFFTAFLIIPYLFGIFDAAVTAKKQQLTDGVAILSPAVYTVRERR